MSRTLFTTLWAGTVLIVSTGTAFATTELDDPMTGRRDMTADWFDIRIDDDLFAHPAHGQFGMETMRNRSAGFTALLGDVIDLGEISVRPFSSLTYSRPYDDAYGRSVPSYAAQDTLAGAIGLQTSALFSTGLGPLETLIDLYLAHELDVDGVRFKTLPGALRRSIRSEPVDPAKFDFENALSLRVKGIVPGYFHYETRMRVRSSGIREVTGNIRFRW